MNLIDRVQHRLELQALELEELLARNDLTAQVEGGVVGLDGVTFQIQLDELPPELVQNQLQADLKETFPTMRVQLSFEGGFMRIALGYSRHLQLLELIEGKISLAPCTSLLGIASDETPLILNFADSALEHVIFFGSQASGKTAALRSCAVSLALSSRQSQVQMLYIDPQCDRPESGQGPGLQALHYLPHALAAVVSSVEDCAEVLNYLEEEARYRRSHRIVAPTIALFIDNVDALLDEGSLSIQLNLQHLLGRGAESGIHCLLAARPPRTPDDDALTRLLALKPMLRVVGHVDDVKQSQSSSLIAKLGAENLQGKGDFLLARQDNPVRFRSAFVDSYDLHWCLETLQRRRPPAILARPTTTRPPVFARQPTHDASQSFSFDGQKITLEQSSQPSLFP